MLILALYVVALGQLVLGQAPQVTTSQGTMRGQVLKSRDGRDYFSFTKIPYAKPPVGDRRFKISQRATNWQGVLDATQNPPYCFQRNRFNGSEFIGEEDCLYLNVFSPNLTGRYPVIFAIHGGGFSVGSADFCLNAKFFMDEEVVVVAPQYRLGTLGFLSLEDEVIPGNLGLKDQALALEWVHKEISAFGGDPNQITVIGESAGGASSDIICSAPRTNGIFKACISQSGLGNSFWAINKNQGVPKKLALNFAKVIGCDVGGDLKCLQSKPLALVGNMSVFFNEDIVHSANPVLEPPGVPGALLTSWPTSTNRSYPWIIGVCQDDGYVFLLMHLKNQGDIKKFINGFNQTLIATHHLENRIEDFERLRARFFKKEVEPIIAIRNYYTEAMFVYPALKSLRNHPGPVYFYKFNYTRGPWRTSYDASSIQGVPHAAEMPYLFGVKSSLPDWPNANDLALSRMLVKMWANFARYQNPSSQDTAQWPQFQGQYYLDIQDSGVNISKWVDMEETLDFWKSIEGNS